MMGCQLTTLKEGADYNSVSILNSPLTISPVCKGYIDFDYKDYTFDYYLIIHCYYYPMVSST